MSLFTGAVLLGVVLAALTVGVWWKKTNVLELLVLGVVYWLCTWVISGMGLFVLDQFSLRRCVIAAVSVELLVGIGTKAAGQDPVETAGADFMERAYLLDSCGGACRRFCAGGIQA